MFAVAVSVAMMMMQAGGFPNLPPSDLQVNFAGAGAGSGSGTMTYVNRTWTSGSIDLKYGSIQVLANVAGGFDARGIVGRIHTVTVKFWAAHGGPARGAPLTTYTWLSDGVGHDFRLSGTAANSVDFDQLLGGTLTISW